MDECHAAQRQGRVVPHKARRCIGKATGIAADRDDRHVGSFSNARVQVTRIAKGRARSDRRFAGASARSGATGSIRQGGDRADPKYADQPDLRAAYGAVHDLGWTACIRGACLGMGGRRPAGRNSDIPAIKGAWRVSGN